MKRTIHETNEPITRTKCKRTENERTIHANETNEKRERYEISVSLNDPGSVSKGESIMDNAEKWQYRVHRTKKNNAITQRNMTCWAPLCANNMLSAVSHATK